MNDIETYGRRHDVARQFESLGDNCELGMLQRAWGVEYSNLFRWAFSESVPELLTLLRNRCAGLYDFENLEPYGGGEMVLDRAYGIAFHSDMRSAYKRGAWTFLADEDSRLDLYSNEYQKMTHLIVSTRRKLAEGRKIFVYKRNDGVTEAEALELHGALQPYGPVELLVVNLASGADLPGTARQLRPGLFLGFLDRFAAYSNAGDASVEAWFKLLVAVLALARPAAAEPAAPVASLCDMIERGMDDPAALARIRMQDWPFGGYRKLQTDLAQLGWPDEQLFTSYLTFGYFEGRYWQGGEDEPPFPSDALGRLDHCYRLQIHALALRLLSEHKDELLGTYRAFVVAVTLGAAPALQRAYYEALRARPGFGTFRDRCGSLFSRFFIQAPHPDFADYVAARKAADNLMGWSPQVLSAAIERHSAEYPELRQRLAGVSLAG
jgi:hypothetical protein